MKIVFDASQFKPEHRNLAWKAALCQIYVNLETELDHGTYYSGRVREACFGDLRIMQSEASEQTIVRRESHLAHVDKDCYYLQLMQRGTSVLEQGGRQLLGNANSATLYYAGEIYRLQYAQPSSCFYLEIPRASLSARLRNISDPLCLNFSTATGIGKILSDFCISLALEGNSLIDSVREKMANQILEIVACVIENPSGERGRVSLRKIPLCVIKEFIERNLSDPSLTVQAIASHHVVSTRYVQYLFKESGFTTAEWIWHKRLQRSYKLLADPEYAQQSVTDIALSVGFNSPSHFSTAFKAKFGKTPREVRRAVW